jgi:hypothetical protein
MSGQPNQTPMDASKFRQAYMANLNLRIALDDKNLQANKTYNKTGQLPVEPSDFRTTEEKLADVLTLRKDVRSQLGEIADGVNANKISVELTPAELVFYYQQSNTINKLIKERYSKGVLANIFIPYLQKYMADSLANKGVASGLQQVSAPNLLLSGENIARALATEPDYQGLMESYMNSGINILKQIRMAISVLPPVDLFQKINAITDENERFRLLEEANNYLKDLPSKNEISSKIIEIQRLKNSNDKSGLNGESDRVISLITPSSDTFIQLNNLLRAIGESPIQPTPSAPSSSASSVAPSPKNPLLDIIDKVMNYDDFIQLTKSDKLAILDALDKNIIPNQLFGDKKLLMYSRTSVGRKNAGELNQRLLNLKVIGGDKTIMDAISELRSEINSRMSGMGFQILKIKPKRYDMIKKSDIDTSMGLEKPPRYIPFGRYLINRNRLNNGVVSIKRPSGGSIKEFPSQKVSGTLISVLKKIVGKGVPAFEDLEALTEEEKSYLHTLAKESQIIDRLSIPAPKKDELDKDFNRFEILKGQITSGNDNKEVIKEFKMLIMKLSNMKKIPKSQARDILFDLTSMGF